MINLADIEAAERCVSPYLVKTPLEHSRTLSDDLGAHVYLKMEIFQKTGSFKPRGAFNQILQMDPSARSKGVVAVSGGNFAQGAAYAASHLGLEAIICMPDYTPANYVEATKSYGARVELTPDFPSTFVRAQQFVSQGYGFLHAWDNPHQMAGNGTLGLEILAELPELTDLFISIGGGGLIAGMIVAIKSLKPAVRIWGVETEGAETMGQALQAGEVVHITPTSLARTLGGPYIAEDALRLAQAHLHDYVVVSDQAAIDAQRYLLERTKVLTELAASCTLAAARTVRQRFQPDDQVVLLLCGGNESLSNMITYAGLTQG